MFAIKKMREHAGLSQQQVADYLGIKTPRYGDWERETTTINLRDAIRIADLFQCTLDELAGRDWPKASSPPLSRTEHGIVDAYRACDQSGQEAIQAAVDGISRRFDKKGHKDMAERGA